VCVYMPDKETALACGIVAGCPEGYSFLRACAFQQVNSFLFGSPCVRLNAAAAGAARNGSLLSQLSRVAPAIYYSVGQKHIPYSRERLTSRRIAREAAQSLSYDDLASTQESLKHFQRKVWALLTRLRGDQKWYSLRFGAWLCTHIFKWLFNGEIYVSTDATDILRAQADRTTFVYVPTHKSHLDYHMLSFVLFAESLACPHIAAGVPLTSVATLQCITDVY
jgi:glycerol-3-phosphate O-acyltransferase